MLKDGIKFGKENVPELTFDGGARSKFEQFYYACADELPGVLGAITARAEPHVVRLAMIYALLDLSTTIRAEHVTAAIATWNYTVDSCKLIFGETTGLPRADQIRTALELRPLGMTLCEINREVFKSNVPGLEIRRALQFLADAGLASSKQDRNSQGQIAERWRLNTHT